MRQWVVRQWVVMRFSTSIAPLSDRSYHLYQRPLSQLHYFHPASISRRSMQTSSKPLLVSIPPVSQTSSSLPPPAPPPPPSNTLSTLAATTAHPTYSTTTSSSSPRQPPTLEPPDHLDAKELEIFRKLTSELSPSRLDVQDVSGGCGSMYAIEVASPKFKGLTIMKQHRLVQSILAEEIKGWHGVQLRTKAE